MRGSFIQNAVVYYPTAQRGRSVWVKATQDEVDAKSVANKKGPPSRRALSHCATRGAARIRPDVASATSDDG